MSDNGEKDAEPSTSLKRSRDESPEADAGITMLDVLKDEEELEEDAIAVLGNADDEHCSYHSGGYMKRQALYACITCSVPESPDFEPAALCLACSYHCHPSHEIVELYTKRNFRCDCGNSKLKMNPCKIVADKMPINDRNRYNQNFKGLYCICNRPHPDPEDDTPDQMIQCIICEDWFHGRHLEGVGSTPKEDSYAEMVCHLCANKHANFLAAYSGLAVTKVKKSETCDDSINNGKDEETDLEVSIQDSSESDQPKSISAAKDSPMEASGSSSQTNGSTPGSSCRIKSSPAAASGALLHALFLPGNWRDQLCTCDDCKKMYEESELEFLLDPEDTVHHYESLATSAEPSTSYKRGMEALGEMDRVKQIEAIRGYNEMKDSLKEFLKKFADEGKVVGREDIEAFFATMKSAKRQKIEIPQFCR